MLETRDAIITFIIFLVRKKTTNDTKEHQLIQVPLIDYILN